MSKMRTVSVGLLITALMSSITIEVADANHTSQANPWKRTWSSKDFERIAKTTYCINHGYRDYNWKKDKCKR